MLYFCDSFFPERCDPIGGMSVWSTFGTGTTEPKKEIIALSAGVDALSFIHDLSNGAAQKLNVVVLLAIAEALSRVDFSLYV